MCVFSSRLFLFHRLHLHLDKFYWQKIKIVTFKGVKEIFISEKFQINFFEYSTKKIQISREIFCEDKKFIAYIQDLIKTNLMIDSTLHSYFEKKAEIHVSIMGELQLNEFFNIYIRTYTYYIHKKKLLDSRKFSTSGYRWIYMFWDVLNTIWPFLENVCLSVCTILWTRYLKN